MENKKTERGFAYVTFNDRYNTACSIQKSSLATEDAIWLGVNNANPIIMASQAKAFGIETDKTTGWVPYPIPKEVLLSTSMHLNVEDVEKLIPILQNFVETGEVDVKGENNV